MKKATKYSRVTSVLSFLNSSWLQYWYRKVGFQEADRVSRESQEFGKEVHKIIEGHVREEYYISTNILHMRCAHLAIKWLDENHIKPLYIEQELKDKALKLIGHCDLIAEINGEQIILDYKTSKKIDRSYALQLAAYAHMANKSLGTRITKGIILRVDKDPLSEQQLEVVTYVPLKPYWAIFRAGLLFFKYMNGK